MLVGVDWGTTHLRAVLMDEAGTVVDRAASGAGLSGVADGGFEAALGAVIAPWGERSAGAPILMSGMVGSRQGWREAPYVDLPARLEALAGAALVLDSALGRIAIVPGVAAGAAGGRADVMRGEETEIFGALHALGRREGTVVLPGTHSKWVRVEDGAIVDFRTFMTGELFHVVRHHTILARMMAGEADDAAGFDAGLDAARALDGPGELMARLFSLRAEALFGRMPEARAPSVLSGLLVGAEVASALGATRAPVLVGASGLARWYRRALEAFGAAPVEAPEHSAARGQWLVHRAMAR